MGIKEENKEIYPKLRDLRRARGLTVNKLAEKMGENHQKVSRIERGRRSLTVDYLMKISKALDTSVETLLSENESVFNKQEGMPKGAAILNEIVIFVEENQKRLGLNFDPQKKAKTISKLYELTQKFPEAFQEQFLHSLLEGMTYFLDLEFSKST